VLAWLAAQRAHEGSGIAHDRHVELVRLSSSQ
jgi:hypothetical protein